MIFSRKAKINFPEIFAKIWKWKFCFTHSQGPFNSFIRLSVSYYPVPNHAKFRAKQNSAEFGRIPWHGIPYNSAEFSKFRMTYGSKKNVRNSVLMEFRGHPKWEPTVHTQCTVKGWVNLNSIELLYLVLVFCHYGNFILISVKGGFF
jgi:hypothetical protein